MTADNSVSFYNHRDSCIRSAIIVSATILVAVTACNPSPSSDDGWPFGASDTAPADTSDVATDTPETPTDAPSDASPDTPKDGPWTGWLQWKPVHQTFMPDSHVENVSGEPGGSSFVGRCQIQIQPPNPAWLVDPAPVQTDFWRVRQPASTTGPTERPPLSETRFGHIRIDGILEESPGDADDNQVDGQLQNAEIEPHACDTMQTLGRCGVPNPGDLCYTGVESFSPIDDPELSAISLPDEKKPSDTTLDFDFNIDFTPRVADASLDVGLHFTVPRFGPADGTIHDWTLDEVIDGTIRRVCSSWGRSTIIDYPLSDANGWIRRIPARNRDSGQSLLIVNLKTITGIDTANHNHPDTGPDPPSCSNEPMELWFAVEYGN